VALAKYNERMSELPSFIHTAAQLRALDRHAVEQMGVPSYVLMTRAGEAALKTLRCSWPQAKRIVVVCGAGNNAGDGYVLARLAHAAGLRVVTMALFDPATLQGDALTAWRDFSTAGCRTVAWLDSEVRRADVIVDAIFGIGLSRPLDARLTAYVDAMNAASAPILALDIPSGLHADTGQVMSAAIKATRTLAFVGLKIGFYVGAGPDHVGVVEFDSLGVSDSGAESAALRMTQSWLAKILPPRPRTSHKGTSGHVLIVGGGRGMAGAAHLAGEAALRVGAGLVTIATRAENIAAIVSERPELMVRGIETRDALEPLINTADVVAIGPGLGQDEWARAMFAAVLATNKPLVVDADALNLLAQHQQARGNWILTPHPGEAARLLALNTSQLQADRLASAQVLAKRYRAVSVLKGAGSIVTRHSDAIETPFICDAGNPGMATAGMGDVLTGVIAGLHGQLGDAFVAARAGVLVHALAGDCAAAAGQRGLIASDLFPHLRTMVNPHA
jgi:hydroxyethylthiazole kinase-like uncharacterized protein yjeF